jgi:exodeoxyribonuclease V gamma subunit
MTPRFNVHRASRTERLADELIARLDAHPPQNPLAAQRVIVPHAGMRRWLLQTIARHRENVRGVAANIDTPLPWQWLQRTAKQVLGDDALIGGDYRTDVLRWHIFHALSDIRVAAIDHYLAGADGERRRFLLAARLADVFTQYLVYRPAMILAWETGADTADWQAQLWRRVRARIREPHRAQQRDALVRELHARGDGETAPLHVFGVSELPDDVLASLRAVSAHRSVHLYFPDPCREHWEELRRLRAMLLRDDAASLYFEIGHPLLASLGRVGQDFSLALDDGGEQRDPLDERAAPPQAASLLDALQTSIRLLEPDYVRNAFPVPSRADASLRVHACHTRLRELEVLKDQLLGVLADDASLQPRDIVVMAPDIAAYAPYLPAVFGEPARYDADPSHIPWHLSDVPLAQSHPLFDGFARLLSLTESRFRAGDVMDLLAVPAIARRFGLDDETRTRLQPWIRRARIAWGLDAAMKEHAGAAPVDANTWSFGFDRLYAGFVAGNESTTTLVDGDILPIDGVGGGDVEAIGKLDRFVDTLRRLRAGFAVSRPLAAWSAWLLELVDASFAVDRRDDAEDGAMDSLRRTLGTLASQAAAAGNEPLPWNVVRDAVFAALDDVSERQPFLLGGVTFCGLVPQRAIPFRVVCLLGMNENEFPRSAGDGGLNRMQRQPRRGDRDTRNEDRYLFLEAIMAARGVLHVSFLGADPAEGGHRNPAAPVSELLEFLDAQFAVAPDADEASRPWFVRHPLQPFDVRYFERGGDARFFSFDAAYAERPLRSDASIPFVDVRETASTDVDDTELALTSLKLFWRDPAKASVRDGLGVSLDALGDDRLAESEPLTADTERRERFAAQLVVRALRAGEPRIPDAPPAWLHRSGALPAGDIGARAYRKLRERAQPMLAALRDRFGAQPQETSLAVDIPLDAARLVGVVEPVFIAPDGKPCLTYFRPDGAAGLREVLPFYIDWAAARLARGDAIEALFLECDGTKVKPVELCEAIVAQTPDELRLGLLELVQMRRRIASLPRLFFPKTSWAWMTAKDDKRDETAGTEWEGSGRFKKGEALYEPGYSALIARDRPFLVASTPAHDDFVAMNKWIAHILDPRGTASLDGERRA